MKLKGKIDKIIYHNNENGFTVAIFKRDEFSSDTVTGNFHTINEGDEFEFEGDWTVHPRYGKQFKAESFEPVYPETENDITAYLGSGIIKGIGPSLAKRIVDRFGSEAFDILDNDPEKLKGIDGIGKKKLKEIKTSWTEQRAVKDAALFLKKCGVGNVLAAKIIKRYGASAQGLIESNPYRLIDELYGVGFLTADKIAKNIGFAEDSSQRVEAAVIYTLKRLSEEGHVYYPLNGLLQKCSSFLNADRETIMSALYNLQNSERILLGNGGSSEEGEAVYLSEMHEAESGAAALVQLIGSRKIKIKERDEAENILLIIKENMDIELSEDQFQAVKAVLDNKMMVITGGPGTGKTTIINTIIKLFRGLQMNVLLGAPTGRAAKRMSESANYDARTIHRLLEFNPLEGIFTRDEENPIDCDLLIIDEMSMVDISLFYSLLKAVPLHASVVFVGDSDQLPSVGPGNVLESLIASERITSIRLTKIFRQAEQSKIITGAHAINSGVMPEFSNEPDNDFFFIRTSARETIVERILDLCSKDLPEKFDFNPYEDIQVIAPMYKGPIGVDNLNRALQERLNPDGQEIRKGNIPLKVNDKVMQIRNNYEKDIYNGDIGRILSHDKEKGKINILFEEKLVNYEFSELDEIKPAYAISVHKSQGSEYPVVIMPVVTEHYIMLQRKLIYTAVTRAKSLLMMLGLPNALNMAVKNNRSNFRYSLLKERLQNENI